jgi:DNA-binding MarR family transcriptional regulator
VGIKSTQFSILSEVDHGSVSGPVTMCELATAMVMDRSTLGHNLKPLERDQLIVLRLSAEDRRKRHVELTKKGRSMLMKARRLWRHAEGRFETIFGKEPAAELRAVLLGIAGNKELNSLPIR